MFARNKASAGFAAVLLGIVLTATSCSGAAKRWNGDGGRHHAPRSEWKGRREREGGDAAGTNQRRGNGSSSRPIHRWLIRGFASR
jgi:hypothetical protein